MSLWWARKNQLDEHQVELIENTPLEGNYLVVGPPGSGKTNVLLRRAQFVRAQNMPNILVLTFTRSLTEFIRTGCYADGKNIFPEKLITTVEAWVRSIFQECKTETPNNSQNHKERRISFAEKAVECLEDASIPKYDAIFVDEGQDLLEAEVRLLAHRTNNLFIVGDDRQRIYDGAAGVEGLSKIVSKLEKRTLPFHYRIVPEICAMADKILIPTGQNSLASTAHYKGPKPGRISVEGPHTRGDQLALASKILKDQVRVYGDLIADGDRLGVVVPRKNDRDEVYEFLEADPELNGKSQVVRARDGTTTDSHNPEIAAAQPILILTKQGVKGLEFRGVQWLFADDLQNYETPEKVYTVVTRAKTSLDIYFTETEPPYVAKSYAKPTEGGLW